MTVGSISVRCNAKINLYLEVIRKRDDGYHDIETVFQPVSLHDIIRIERTSGGISLTGDDPGIPWDSSNLCWKAAELILGEYGEGKGVSLDVRKNIPSGAGLGGGSSDAAGVLAGVNELLGLEIDVTRLMEMALEIGSDVPFFLFGSPAVGKGRGEILEKTEGLSGGTLLIVKPDINVSTKWAYQNPNLILTRSDGGHKLNCLLGGLKDFPDIALETSNSFQGVVVGEYPVIGQILVLLKSEGARLSSMSGSGSACFALYEDDTTASRVRDLMLGEGHSVWIVYPAGRTLELLERE
ncbi:MAG: 4-(cytidine 5'-diphospho)-2-C-methyl-D-erythritol kinase [Candidatus Krumholzibacteria bacterium]|nr:4-(cytidine 5'-diphospho)-2-C-methyl-D-erythritol kinase [Candidatus Krumholzibacteria bacterium]